MSSTVVDEKLNAYRKIQSDIQGLFLQKQQALSQFNENTLVKGVSVLLVSDDYLILHSGA